MYHAATMKPVFMIFDILALHGTYSVFLLCRSAIINQYNIGKHVGIQPLAERFPHMTTVVSQYREAIRTLNPNVAAGLPFTIICKKFFSKTQITDLMKNYIKRVGFAKCFIIIIIIIFTVSQVKLTQKAERRCNIL